MIDFYDEYISFCKINGYNDDRCPNSRAFGGRIVGLNLPMNKVKKQVSTYWKFTPNEVYELMEKKRWINDFGEDLVVEDEGIDEDDDYLENYEQRYGD